MQPVAIKAMMFTAGAVIALAMPAGRILMAAGTTTGVSIPAVGASNTEMRELEQEMLNLVNQDRLNSANLAETGDRALPLIWDERLAEAAQARSENMIARDYFGHVDPNGMTPDVHLTAAGIHWQAMAENIVIRSTVERGEAAFIDEPRFQPNHRGAILNPQFTHIGIGIVRAPNGELYITQEFARFR
ncbi:MAG: CAP domain-containing protein [Terriglobia bacterium]